ncbi:MAG: class I SAM-dependent methyltransferase [Bacteroidales bacterium]
MLNKNNNRYWDRRAGVYDKKNAYGKSRIYAKCIDLIRQSIDKGCSVVDLGCGTGLVTYSLADIAASITAIDSSEGMISMARAKKRKGLHEHITFTMADMHYTGLPPQAADVTLLCNVLHHSYSPQALLMEAKRITKPNGLIIIFTNCYASIRGINGFIAFTQGFLGRAFRLIPWVKLYSLRRLRNALENSGMVIIAERKFSHRSILGLFTILKT